MDVINVCKTYSSVIVFKPGRSYNLLTISQMYVYKFVIAGRSYKI